MSNRRRRDSFWRQEAGGAPFWFLAAALVFVMGGGAWALVYSTASQSEASQTSRTLAPIPTFGTPQEDALRVAIIGDSYTDGSAMNTEPTWARSLGIEGVVDIFAIGGSGYITSNEAVAPRNEP